MILIGKPPQGDHHVALNRIVERDGFAPGGVRRRGRAAASGRRCILLSVPDLCRGWFGGWPLGTGPQWRQRECVCRDSGTAGGTLARPEHGRDRRNTTGCRGAGDLSHFRSNRRIERDRRPYIYGGSTAEQVELHEPGA